jgi:tetratricopeptide (TPR) repeat protein
MEDKTKICPYCREEISILARKCKYCGEMVGDPLKHERTLTVDDIGRPEESRDTSGETLISAYQALQTELRQKTETMHKEVKRSVMSLPSVRQTLLVIIIVSVLAGLVLGSLAIVRFVGRQRAYLQDQHVVAILKEANEFKRAGSLVEALRTANRALEVHADSQRAQDMLEDIRVEIKDQLERLYRARQYNRAIDYAEQALSIEPENSAFMLMAQLAEQDRNRYSLQLAGIVQDAEGNNVAAIRTYPRGVVNVNVGDTLEDMQVVAIDPENAQVSLYDTLRDVNLKVGKGGCIFEDAR